MTTSLQKSPSLADGHDGAFTLIYHRERQGHKVTVVADVDEFGSMRVQVDILDGFLLQDGWEREGA